MTKHDLALDLVSIQGLLEIAKECLLEERPQEAQQLLQKAVREIKQVNWKMVPISN